MYVLKTPMSVTFPAAIVPAMQTLANNTGYTLNAYMENRINRNTLQMAEEGLITLDRERLIDLLSTIPQNLTYLFNTNISGNFLESLKELSDKSIFSMLKFIYDLLATPTFHINSVTGANIYRIKNKSNFKDKNDVENLLLFYFLPGNAVFGKGHTPIAQYVYKTVDGSKIYSAIHGLNDTDTFFIFRFQNVNKLSRPVDRFDDICNFLGIGSAYDVVQLPFTKLDKLLDACKRVII